MSFLSPSLWKMARYRLKYCLKGLLNPKQATNQITPKSLIDESRVLEVFWRRKIHLVTEVRKIDIDIGSFWSLGRGRGRGEGIKY